MRCDSRFDDKPIACRHTATVGHARECRRQHNAFLTRVGESGHHATVVTDDEAATAVLGGVSESRFE
jgi:hypothetical protein